MVLMTRRRLWQGTCALRLNACGKSLLVSCGSSPRFAVDKTRGRVKDRSAVTWITRSQRQADCRIVEVGDREQAFRGGSDKRMLEALPIHLLQLVAQWIERQSSKLRVASSILA